ncbi:MAG: hypothetical protein ACJ70Q_03885 [Nitrososphaera sp.]
MDKALELVQSFLKEEEEEEEARAKVKAREGLGRSVYRKTYTHTL